TLWPLPSRRLTISPPITPKPTNPRFAMDLFLPPNCLLPFSFGLNRRALSSNLPAPASCALSSPRVLLRHPDAPPHPKFSCGDTGPAPARLPPEKFPSVARG